MAIFQDCSRLISSRWQPQLGEDLKTVSELLSQRAREFPESIFLKMEEGSLTYLQVETQASKLAKSLSDIGVTKESAVVLMMHNSLDQVICWFALNRLGAIHVPLNTSLVGELAKHALSIANPQLIIADEALFDAIAKPLYDLGLNPKVVLRGANLVDENKLALSELLKNDGHMGITSVDPLATATLLFTSGTSGRSKACELSNTYLVRAGEIHVKYVGITKNDVLYCPFPLFHIDAATLTVMAALSVGATAAIAKRFSVSKFWDDVRKYEATIFNFMGATLSMLWKQPPSDTDLTHQVRLAWGVPIPDWQSEFEERFGFSIYQVYGLTDAGVMVYDPQDGSQKYGYAGKLIDEYDLKIVDFDLNPVPIGTLGEIMLKGKEPGLMMNGYYGMPEATAAAFVDGWYRTGDLGQLDNEQCLAFLGRLADSIRRRGENISAFEVEEMVSAHPAVLEVGAIGVPSELTEEDVKVVVALKPGCSATHEEIYQFCVETGVKYMVPKYIEFMDVIPKTPTEKVQKYRLKEVWKNSNTWDTDTKLFLDSGSN